MAGSSYRQRRYVSGENAIITASSSNQGSGVGDGSELVGEFSGSDDRAVDGLMSQLWKLQSSTEASIETMKDKAAIKREGSMTTTTITITVT
eukprot:gene20662-27448_t